MKAAIVAAAILVASAAVIAIEWMLWPAFALPSVTSLVILADLVARGLRMPVLRREDHGVLFIAAAACGVLLYASTLGYVALDVYGIGFSAAAPLVMGVAAVLIARRAPRAACTALVVLLAYDFDLLRSRNLFDYALDPFLVLGACAWCLAAGRRRLGQVSGFRFVGRVLSREG